MSEDRVFYLHNDSIKGQAVRAVRDAPTNPEKLYQVAIKEVKSKRSAAQNRLLWMWNGCIQAHMADCFGQYASAEEWHEILVGRLLPSKIYEVRLPGEGYTHQVGRTRTSQLTVKKMAEYMERLDAYCSTMLELQLPHPEVLWAMAMGY